MKREVRYFDMMTAPNAFFMDDEQTRICTFQQWPEPGDYMTCKMVSGKTGKYKVIKRNTPSDPGDQTFLTVKFDGYL